jgi:hypothetical protein
MESLELPNPKGREIGLLSLLEIQIGGFNPFKKSEG